MHRFGAPADILAMTAGDLVTGESELESEGSRERSEGAIEETLGAQEGRRAPRRGRRVDPELITERKLP